MIVKIRVGGKARTAKTSRLPRQFALATAALLTPVSVMACALGCWRVAADMQWTGEFAISKGLFSHWQVWMGIGAGMQAAAVMLNRYANVERFPGDDAAAS